MGDIPNGRAFVESALTQNYDHAKLNHIKHFIQTSQQNTVDRVDRAKSKVDRVCFLALSTAETYTQQAFETPKNQVDRVDRVGVSNFLYINIFLSDIQRFPTTPNTPAKRKKYPFKKICTTRM